MVHAELSGNHHSGRPFDMARFLTRLLSSHGLTADEIEEQTWKRIRLEELTYLRHCANLSGTVNLYNQLDITHSQTFLMKRASQSS